jgi:hypothetical protein
MYPALEDLKNQFASSEYCSAPFQGVEIGKEVHQTSDEILSPSAYNSRGVELQLVPRFEDQVQLRMIELTD